ncbi:gentisate 1,2-dioxygenase [Alloalcanivorax sp. C16-1]|uniref:gentisate 1,2-dioxygenase n=1 Tax=Alloalcanivorax sp. C16-1 TaxID=3390051 RepID=UPI003970E81D
MAGNIPSPHRRAFYQRLAAFDAAPLWEVLGNIVPRQPASRYHAHQWHYSRLRPLLLEAGDLLTAEEAERRVLVLENPSCPGQSRATPSLYAGLQLILPGETAPAHRHTPSALRFLIEGERGYTSVGGERTTMREGDFVITPAWAWHDHGNDGDEPVIWLDGLDIPVISYFESVFSDPHEESRQPLSRPEGDSLARYGQNLLPINARSPYGPTTPIFNYPYERTRDALIKAALGAAPDEYWGTTLRYANPIDGGWPMPTLATWMTHLRKGERTRALRSTDSQVMHVVEGRGEISVDGQVMSFGPKDVIAIPGWQWRTLSASEDCFLFFFSDRALHEKLGFHREERQS